MTADGGEVPGPDALALDALTVRYRDHVAIEDISCRLAPGSLCAVIGPNGAGKSTLLKAIVGELAPASGQIAAPAEAAGRLAYLPQRAEIERRFPILTRDFVLLGAWRRIGPFQRVGRAERDRLQAALAAVGLDREGGRPIGALSIGQFQRALFARILVQDALLILLDEPFAGVDAATTEALLALLPGWRADGRTVLCALHDADQVRRHFPETLWLDRRMVAFGPTARVLDQPGLDRLRALS